MNVSPPFLFLPSLPPTLRRIKEIGGCGKNARCRPWVIKKGNTHKRQHWRMGGAQSAVNKTAPMFWPRSLETVYSTQQVQQLNWSLHQVRRKKERIQRTDCDSFVRHSEKKRRKKEKRGTKARSASSSLPRDRRPTPPSTYT